MRRARHDGHRISRSACCASGETARAGTRSVDHKKTTFRDNALNVGDCFRLPKSRVQSVCQGHIDSGLDLRKNTISSPINRLTIGACENSFQVSTYNHSQEFRQNSDTNHEINESRDSAFSNQLSHAQSKIIKSVGSTQWQQQI